MGMSGVPAVTPGRLRSFPLTCATGLGVAGLSLWLIIGPTLSWMLAALMAAIGAGLGLIAVYRSRWSLRHARTSFVVATLVFVLANVWAISFAQRYADLGWGTGWLMTMAALLLAGSMAVGAWWQSRRLAQAIRADRLAECLQAHADLDRRIYFALPHGSADSGIAYIGLATAIGVNVPLALRLIGVGDIAIVWLVPALAMGLSAYLFSAFIGPGLVRVALLGSLERATGRRFVSDQISEVNRLRRGFWGARRWCLPEDTADPVPASRSDARTRRHRKRR